MLCEKCKKRTATVFYNENINGKVRSFSLCAECAAKMREKGDLQDVMSLSGSFADPFFQLHDDFFGGFFGIPASIQAGTEKKCPVCSSTYREIAQSGRVGCPQCYETFREELSPMIRSVHGTNSHTGNVPSRHRAKKEREARLKQMKKDLHAAVEREDFEKAASLRDQIRTMEADGKKESD